MQSSPVFDRPSPTGDDRRASMTIKSGPGAVMFEPGPNTRIRRTPVRAIASVTIEDGPREIFGRVLNVSPGGCRLRTEATLAVGNLVEMSITVIGDGFRARVDVEGVIRRVDEDTERPEYGVEFLAIDSRDKQSLEWLYAQAMR